MIELSLFVVIRNPIRSGKEQEFQSIDRRIAWDRPRLSILQAIFD